VEFPTEKLTLWQIAFRLHNENPLTESPPLNVQNELIRMADAIMANRLWVKFLPGRQPDLFVVLAKCREGNEFNKKELNLIFVSREDWAAYESAKLEKANSAPAAKVEAVTVTQPAPAAQIATWHNEARKIGETIYKQTPKLNLEQIAAKVHAEMMKQKSEPGMTGRGGKVPSAGSIKRHALKGLKS